MPEQHEKDQEQQEQQEQQEHVQENPPENMTSTAAESPAEEPSRPRPATEHQETVQIGRERLVQRTSREAMRSRGIAESERPQAAGSRAIQHQEKRSTGNQSSHSQGSTASPGVLEERASVKWAAWGALLISLVALLLVGIYSSRDFGPEFQLRDFEITQQKLVDDVDTLKYDTQLEKVKIALLNAYFQIFARKDHATAELILTSTREELNHLIDSLPVEKSTEPKQILNNLDDILREVRKGPSPIDERLKSVLLEIERLSVSP